MFVWYVGKDAINERKFFISFQEKTHIIPFLLSSADFLYFYQTVEKKIFKPFAQFQESNQM